MGTSRKASAKNEQKPTPPSGPVTPRTMKLRMKQNDFVAGKFAPKGSIHEFPYEEGNRRLTTTDKFEPIS